MTDHILQKKTQKLYHINNNYNYTFLNNFKDYYDIQRIYNLLKQLSGLQMLSVVDELEMMNYLKTNNFVSKKTFMVIVKDKDEDTGKVEEARKLGIPVMTPDEIEKKYDL